jgi:hypothetical protein
MADFAVSVPGAAGRFSGWFVARPTWLKVIIVLLGCPLPMAADIAMKRSAGFGRSEQRASLV